MSKHDKGKPKARQDSGFLYAMKNASHPENGIKVGITEKPQQRLQDIRGGDHPPFAKKGDCVRWIDKIPSNSCGKDEKALQKELGMTEEDREITHKPEEEVRKAMQKVTGNKQKKGG